MKISAVLFILSVCYIASTEQARKPWRQYDESQYSEKNPMSVESQFQNLMTARKPENSGKKYIGPHTQAFPCMFGYGNVSCKKKQKQKKLTPFLLELKPFLLGLSPSFLMEH